MAIGDLVLGVRICALRILGRLSERHQRPGGHDVVFDGLSSLLGELLNEASRTRHIPCADPLRRSYPAIIRRIVRAQVSHGSSAGRREEAGTLLAALVSACPAVVEPHAPAILQVRQPQR